MQILLNGEPMRLDDNPTISELLQRTGYGERRVAVELNRVIVPRSRHPDQRVSDGDQVEVVQAFGGG